MGIHELFTSSPRDLQLGVTTAILLLSLASAGAARINGSEMEVRKSYQRMRTSIAGKRPVVLEYSLLDDEKTKNKIVIAQTMRAQYVIYTNQEWSVLITPFFNAAMGKANAVDQGRVLKMLNALARKIPKGVNLKAIMKDDYESLAMKQKKPLPTRAEVQVDDYRISLELGLWTSGDAPTLDARVERKQMPKGGWEDTLYE